MDKFIDIVFGGANAGQLKMMNGFFDPKFRLNSKTIINIDCKFSIGNISEDFSNESRFATDAVLLYSFEEDILTTKEEEPVKRMYEYAERLYHEICQIIYYAENGYSLRIWVDKTTNAKCGLLFICGILKNLEFNNIEMYVVDVSRYEDDKEKVFLNTCSDSAKKDALENAVHLDEADIEQNAIKWFKLVDENKPIRIQRDGEIVSVDADYYDRLIVDTYKRMGNRKASRVVGEILGELRDLTFEYLLFRIRYLAENGVLECTEKKGRNEYYKVADESKLSKLPKNMPLENEWVKKYTWRKLWDDKGAVEYYFTKLEECKTPDSIVKCGDDEMSLFSAFLCVYYERMQHRDNFKPQDDSTIKTFKLLPVDLRPEGLDKVFETIDSDVIYKIQINDEYLTPLEIAVENEDLFMILHICRCIEDKDKLATLNTKKLANCFDGVCKNTPIGDRFENAVAIVNVIDLLGVHSYNGTYLEYDAEHIRIKVEQEEPKISKELRDKILMVFDKLREKGFEYSEAKSMAIIIRDEEQANRVLEFISNNDEITMSDVLMCLN